MLVLCGFMIGYKSLYEYWGMYGISMLKDSNWVKSWPCFGLVEVIQCNMGSKNSRATLKRVSVVAQGFLWGNSFPTKNDQENKEKHHMDRSHVFRVRHPHPHPPSPRSAISRVVKRFSTKRYYAIHMWLTKCNAVYLPPALWGWYRFVYLGFFYLFYSYTNNDFAFDQLY